ncbi:MAG: hypothetical protein H6Q27_1402, partial [Ignavibacteriaceae bacterium]|nr:hypothetical protein [Ignavibacteriaceae bacterium]
MFIRSYSLFFLLLLLSQLGLPQSVDSLGLIRSTDLTNLLSTRFYKQLSTFNLNTRFDVTKEWDDFEIRVTENFNSTFVRSTVKSIRDEQFFAVQNKYRINNDLALGLGFSSNIYSDNRQIEINQASSKQIFLFSRIEPENNIFIAPFAGYMNDQQVQNKDDGLLYGVDAVLNKIMISDLIISSDIKFRNEDISPRKNTIRHFNLLLNSEFTNWVSNFLYAAYSQYRKDFYFEADSVTAEEFDISSNIQSRIETGYLI